MVEVVSGNDGASGNKILEGILAWDTIDLLKGPRALCIRAI